MKQSVKMYMYFPPADVKYAEIKMENGKSQGWGLVRFGSAEDAQRAICILFDKTCSSRL